MKLPVTEESKNHSPLASLICWQGAGIEED